LLNLGCLQKCRRWLLSLATLAAAGGPPGVGAQGLTGAVLWYSASEDLKQSGPAALAIRFAAPQGQQFVLIAAELSFPPGQGVQAVRIPAEQIQLATSDVHYPMIGTFDDTGRLQWFASALAILPGGKTRLHAVFQVPLGAQELRLDVGRALQLALPMPQKEPVTPDRLDVAVTEVRPLPTAPPVEGLRPGTPAASVQAWPGARLLAVEVQIDPKNATIDVPFHLTTDDLYLLGAGRLYRCAGILQSDPERLRLGAQSLLVSAEGRRVSLLFCIDARETKLWLCLGSLSVTLDIPH
jgi:hypothetical protein